jgi:hypothetical protein
MRSHWLSRAIYFEHAWTAPTALHIKTSTCSAHYVPVRALYHGRHRRVLDRKGPIEFAQVTHGRFLGGVAKQHDERRRIPFKAEV